MTQHDCPVCGDGFDAERGVRKHAWDVHEACHLCGDGFDEHDGLYAHWLDDHGDALSDAARKRAEKAVGDRTVCPVCGERFDRDAAVRDHAWEAHGACQHCGATFDDERALHTHWLVAHLGALSRDDRRRARDDVGRPGFLDRLAHGGPVAAVEDVQVSRRAVLGAAGVAGAGAVFYGIARALSGGGGGGETLADHAASQDLGSQPVLGPSPAEAAGTIVAFEDPFCPSCRAFELRNFPTLKEDYIDTGDVAFAYRGVPIITRYSDVGTHAMEAVYDRKADAFWRLKTAYYEHQASIDAGNVEARTRDLLGEIDGVDVEAVMSDVRDETYRDAVQTDLRAAQRAGVRGTPTFYLFRDGSYVTRLVGPQSARTFASALGV